MKLPECGSFIPSRCAICRKKFGNDRYYHYSIDESDYIICLNCRDKILKAVNKIAMEVQNETS